MGDTAAAAVNAEPRTEVIEQPTGTGVEHDEPAEAVEAEPERPRWWQIAGPAALCAVLLGYLLNARYLYSSGTGDHLVLAPLGLHWADPNMFGNDWFINEAPQPHWFFDVVTWFGASIGQISVVYFVYWLVSLAVFGVATALLARRWAPAHPWLASILVTLLAASTPWWLLGTGSPLWPQALPVVLAGSTLYLTLAGLLTDRRVLAVSAAVVTAAVHVQQGAVVAVILLALVVLHFVRTRKVDWLFLGGAAASGAVVYGALLARPVVGNLNDFAAVCTEIIPYHCEASSWTRWEMVAGSALVGLALLTVAYRPRGTRLFWATVVALPAFALLGGVLADRYNVPVLGVLAQGLNVYRLDVIMLLLAGWGVLTPVFSKVRPVSRVVLLGAVLLLGYLALGPIRFPPRDALPEHGGPWALLFAAGLVAAVAVVLVRQLRPKQQLVTRVAGVAMVAGIVAGMVSAGTATPRPLDITFFPNDPVREWGQAVNDTLPGGAVLVTPPLAMYARLATGRAVIADCKDVPYGGAAWESYVARINALGGITQCRSKSPMDYNTLPVDDIVAAAREFGADYIVIEEGQQDWLPELREQGWRVVVEPVGELRNRVMKAPWA